MANNKIISETAISQVELRKDLERIKKIDGELNYRANKTEEALTQLIPSDIYKKYDEVYSALTKLNISRLKEQHIKKLIDVLPKTVKEVRAILQSYNITLPNEQAEKIIVIFKDVFGVKKE
ncbi:MAG: hypothetical protein AABY14_00650 [Nanoarchaeota archaeon]